MLFGQRLWTSIILILKNAHDTHKHRQANMKLQNISLKGLQVKDDNESMKQVKKKKGQSKKRLHNAIKEKYIHQTIGGAFTGILWRMIWTRLLSLLAYQWRVLRSIHSLDGAMLELELRSNWMTRRICTRSSIPLLISYMPTQNFSECS